MNDAIKNKVGISVREEKIGTVSAATLAKYNEHKARLHKLQEEVKAKAKAALAEIEKEYAPLEEAINEEHRAVWEEILNEVGSTAGRNGDHRINPHTGAVYKKITEPINPGAGLQ